MSRALDEELNQSDDRVRSVFLAEMTRPGELELLDEPPDPPQAASDRASVVAATAASGSRDFVYRIVRLQSESVGTGLQRRLCGRCSTSKVRSRSAPG